MVGKADLNLAEYFGINFNLFVKILIYFYSLTIRCHDSIVDTMVWAEK